MFVDLQKCLIRLMEYIIESTLLPAGSIGFLLDFEFYMAVLGVPSGPIEFAAPLGFKMLDSQSDSSNIGPVSTDVH